MTIVSEAAGQGLLWGCVVAAVVVAAGIVVWLRKRKRQA